MTIAEKHLKATHDFATGLISFEELRAISVEMREHVRAEREKLLKLMLRQKYDRRSCVAIR